MKITKKIAKEMLNSGNELLIQTALQAYPLLGIDKVSKRALAFIQLEKKIAEVNERNESWVPNWDDDNEKKWYPWFNLRNGKVALDFVYYYSNSAIPPSLVFKNSETCRKFVGDNMELYEKLYRP